MSLPVEVAVNAITFAELAAGPHATDDADERGRRQDRLQRAETAFDPLPSDGDAARAYGRIYAAVINVGRKARGTRAVDLLIAATACAVRLSPCTRNPDAFRGIDTLVEVVPMGGYYDRTESSPSTVRAAASPSSSPVASSGASARSG